MLALLAFAAAAATPPSALEQDLNCHALFSYEVGNADEAEQAEIMPIMLYYVGRVEGRSPGTDIGRELRRLTIDDATFEAHMKGETMRCSAEAAAFAERLARMENLQQQPSTPATKPPRQ